MAVTLTTKISCWFIIVNFLSVMTAEAQDSAAYTKRPVYLEAAFLYDFPQSYGLTVGVSTPFASVVREKVFHNHIVRKQKDYFLLGEAGFYRYPYNYTGIYFFPYVGVHVSREATGIYHEFAAGTGVLRTFYDGKVYQLDAAGNIKELSFFGRYYATVNLTYALGTRFRTPKLNKFDIWLKPALWFQFPYNSFLKPHLSLLIGIRYRFSDINIRTKFHFKQKNK